MIVNKIITITISSKTLSYYKSIGYRVVCNDIILIPYQDLPKGSAIKIDYECDLCKSIYNIKYYNYIINVNKNNGMSICKKCSELKKEKTVLEKYGVKNISQAKEIKTKKEETFLKNFKVKNIFQNKSFIEQKLLEKFNVINPSQLNWVQDKIKQTNLEKFGVEYSLQSKEVKERSKSTNLLKYGTEYSCQSNIIKEKILNTKIRNGNAIDPVFLSEFNIYRKEVDNITKKSKKELFNNWNGYDFYDNEYIKENLNLHYNSPIYPTIDHKKSIYYGFQNNIPAKEIGNLSNLCITKRQINIKKNKKTEIEFLSNYPFC